MDLLPAENAFTAKYDAGEPQVVWTELAADLDTPVSVMLKLGQEQPFTALLESVEGGAVRGRYSFIAHAPDLVWRANGQSAEICRTPDQRPLKFVPEAKQTLASLRSLMAESRIKLPDNLAPMSAGLHGYMGYDTIRLVENIPSKNPDKIGIPEAMFMRPTITIIFDNVDDVLTIVTPVYPKAGMSGAAAYGDARKRILDTVQILERPIPAHTPVASARFEDAVSNTGQAAYHRMVEKAKEYIVAGDIFQVVPSHRMRLPFTLHRFRCTGLCAA